MRQVQLITAALALFLIPFRGLCQEPAAEADDETPVEADEAAEAPLSYQEVMEGMKSPMLRADIETCVETWKHPDQISLKLAIGEDGSVKLTSIDPMPPKDVYLCIAGSVSLLQFRATGMITPVKFAFSLPPQSIFEGEPPPMKPAKTSTAGGNETEHEPPTSVEVIPLFPGGKRAGFGFYGSFLVVDRASVALESEADQTWYGRLTGGIGLFGEYLILPTFALGLEGFLFFPTVKEIEVAGSARAACETCELSFLYGVLARAKLPFRIIPQASLYPILVTGYCGYSHRVEGDRAYNYHGICAGGGAGIEDYTPAATVFFDIRYVFLAGWFDPGRENHPDEDAVKARLMVHSLTLNLGLRFP
jgi:hypothetical protein